MSRRVNGLSQYNYNKIVCMGVSMVCMHVTYDEMMSVSKSSMGSEKMALPTTPPSPPTPKKSISFFLSLSCLLLLQLSNQVINTPKPTCCRRTSTHRRPHPPPNHRCGSRCRRIRCPLITHRSPSLPRRPRIPPLSTHALPQRSTEALRHGGGDVLRDGIGGG